MRKKLLIIEDDQMLAKMYLIKLEKEGFEMEATHNGVEGLRKLEQNKYDLVILDLMMPTMDGFKMLEKYNRSDKYTKAPIIVLSNLGQKDDLDRALALGIRKDRYIVKANVTPSEVVKRIQETLEEDCA